MPRTVWPARAKASEARPAPQPASSRVPGPARRAVIQPMRSGFIAWSGAIGPALSAPMTGAASLTPAELARLARRAGLRMTDSAGMSFDPFSHTWRISRDLGVNYVAAFTR